MSVPVVSLRSRADKRVAAGSPLVYSNDVESDLRSIPAGAMVEVQSSSGRFLGRGLADPHDLVCVRIATGDRAADLNDVAWWRGRLTRALNVRGELGRDAWRWVHAEADSMPGVLLDRLGDVVVVTCTTPGAAQRLDLLKAAIDEVAPAEGGWIRDVDGSVRPWFGESPDRWVVEERGVQLAAFAPGPKWDAWHPELSSERDALARVADGTRVLDVYAHSGAFALRALAAGAEEAWAVDKREEACAAITDAAEEQGLDGGLRVVHDEGKATLKHLIQLGERFDHIVLDPLPFARRKKATRKALEGYQELHELAATLVSPGGCLWTGTRSHPITNDEFLSAVVAGARKAGRDITLIARHGESIDVPVRIDVPDTRLTRRWCFRVDTAT